MIEKFTAEELEIIKRELGIAKTAGSKKAICSKQNKRIADMFPASCDFSQHGMRPRADIWNAMTVLCDYATNNITGHTLGRTEIPQITEVKIGRDIQAFLTKNSILLWPMKYWTYLKNIEI